MSLIIGLSVVIVAFDGRKPRVLATRRERSVDERALARVKAPALVGAHGWVRPEP